MQKYIVEVDAPKKGQVVGTGGIRENGKMASLFKNPKPYVEPSLPQATHTHMQNLSTTSNSKKQFQSLLLHMIWENFGEPLFHYGLNKLTAKAITAIEAHNSIPLDSTSKNEIVDADFTEIESPNSNIIKFPSKRAI